MVFTKCSRIWSSWANSFETSSHFLLFPRCYPASISTFPHYISPIKKRVLIGYVRISTLDYPDFFNVLMCHAPLRITVNCSIWSKQTRDVQQLQFLQTVRLWPVGNADGPRVHAARLSARHVKHQPTATIYQNTTKIICHAPHSLSSASQDPPVY